MNYPDNYYRGEGANNYDASDPFAPERMEHETEQSRIAFGGGQL